SRGDARDLWPGAVGRARFVDRETGSARRMREWLQCIGCGRRFDASEVRYTCECGELLNVERDAMPDRAIFDARLSSRRTIDKSGVWRFREAVLDVGENEIITHPEGSTRLYERGGIFFKHEGENPSGTFK